MSARCFGEKGDAGTSGSMSATQRTGRVGKAGIALTTKNNIGRDRGIVLANAGFEGRLGHLLVVEDNALLAMDVELTALDLGLERVSVAASAPSALQLLETGDVDAALIDFFLGNDDGRIVATRLTELGVPFALMTGSSDFEWLETQVPGVQVLTKPFTKEQLARTLQKLC
jgi:CheY-like chemotaxis protein